MTDARPFSNNIDSPEQAALARANKESRGAATAPIGPVAGGREQAEVRAAPRLPSLYPQRLLANIKSADRKNFPITTGVIDYFPDALPEVAKISFSGNLKHNPGQPLHWARGKSMDHADCIARHLIERGGFDPEGNRHSAQLVWRALALLQEELEAEMKLDAPRGATELPPR